MDLKTVVIPALEAALVAEVNGKECSCLGWSLRIVRLPKTTPPAKPTVQADGTSAAPNEVAAV
jgi:hypothetical protein